jgi:hypothetical protein
VNTSIAFDGRLQAGFYFVEFVVDGETISERMIVE